MIECNFGWALEQLRNGKLVARMGWNGMGWNGMGMFLYLVQGSSFNVSRPPLMGIFPEGTPINYRAHIDMRAADGSTVPWVASQTDLLACDWDVVEAPAQQEDDQ